MKCETCKGREFYYPASNIGGSCKTICPNCNGTGEEPRQQSISDGIEKLNEIIAGEFIKSYGMYDMRLDYHKDIDRFVLKSASMPYEAEENYNQKYSIFKKGISYAQQKSQQETEVLRRKIDDCLLIMDHRFTHIKELEQQIKNLKK